MQYTESQMKMYHIDLHWPSFVPKQLEGIFIPTRHALDRAKEKGIELPKYIKGSCFEVGLIGDGIQKIAIRCRYSDTHDLCLVLSRDASLITCWLNHVSDTHRTLDTSKYMK